jgi:hypothetical protein
MIVDYSIGASTPFRIAPERRSTLDSGGFMCLFVVCVADALEITVLPGSRLNERVVSDLSD